MCKYNSGLTCDTVVQLCKCQTVNTYWSTTAQLCVTYRNYSQSCDSTYLCNANQINLVCMPVPVCNCPTAMVANSCDCQITDYWDPNALNCVPRSTINQTCSINYMCQANVGLTCSGGLCICTYIVIKLKNSHYK